MLLLFRNFVCSVRNSSLSIALSVLLLATLTLTMCQSTSRRLSRRRRLHDSLCHNYAVPTRGCRTLLPRPSLHNFSSDIAAFTRPVHTEIREGHALGGKTSEVRCCALLASECNAYCVRVCVCVCGGGGLQTAARAILLSVLPRDRKGDSQLDWGLGTAQAQWVESALRCSATC